jgi:hypothetical protein
MPPSEPGGVVTPIWIPKVNSPGIEAKRRQEEASYQGRARLHSLSVRIVLPRPDAMHEDDWHATTPRQTARWQ